MNTVRILICVTFALLVGALVHSYTTNGSSSNKVTQVKKSTDERTLSELRQEYESAKLKNKRMRDIYINNPSTFNHFQSATNTPQPANNNGFVNPLATQDLSLTITQPEPEPSMNEELERKLNMLAEENERLKQQQMAIESENVMLQQEAEVIQEEILSPPPVDAARAKVIASAITMARVQVYDPESGILVLDLARPQNITPGQVLGIRRGTAGGIIGRISMGRMEGMVGYADPITSSFFGDVNIIEGDEIIVIP